MQSKLRQFNTILNEGISQEDLAYVLYDRLNYRYPDLVTRYGLEVVGDIIDDVASFHAGIEELGSSDIGGMIRQIISKLERYNQDVQEAKQKETEYDSEWDEKIERLGQMAKQGERKTVWDPVKRVYKTVPVHSDSNTKSSIFKGIKETKGLPFPGTYEQEYNMFNHKDGQKRTQKIAFENKKR